MQDGGDGKDAVGVFGRIHEIPSFKRHDRGALVNFLKGSLIVIRLGAESELSDLVPFLILPMGGELEVHVLLGFREGPGCHFPEGVSPHPVRVAIRAPLGGVFPQLSFLS